MVKHPAPHPTLVTRRLRLRQFSNEDVDAMHECFADPEAMRFWNTPVHSKRVETERAVHRFIDCTPSYYRFWAVADAKTNLCLGMVNYHDGHIRSKRVAIGYIVNPSRRREGIGAEAVSALATLEYIACRPSSIPTMQRLANWSRSSGSAAKDASVTIYAWVTNGATTCCMRCSQPSAQAKLDLMLALLISTHRPNRGGRRPLIISVAAATKSAC